MSEYIPIKVSSETLLALLPQNLQTDELYVDFVKAISYVFNRSVYENLTISENIRDPNFLNANLLDLTAKYLGFSYSSSITDTPTLLNLIPLLGTIYKTKGTNYVEDLFSYVFDTRINIIPIWVQFFRGDKSNPLNYKPTNDVASLTGFYDPSNAYVTNGVPDYSKIYYYTPVDGNYIESCYVVLNLSQQVDYTKLLSFCTYILNKNLVVIGIGNLSNYTGYLTFVDSMNNNIEVTQYTT